MKNAPLPGELPLSNFPLIKGQGKPEIRIHLWLFPIRFRFPIRHVIINTSYGIFERAGTWEVKRNHSDTEYLEPAHTELVECMGGRTQNLV